MPEAQLSSTAMTNKPHGEGTNTLTMGSRGNGERGRRAATCKITIEPSICDGRGSHRGRTAAQLDTKGPSAVMLPSAGSSLSMRDGSLILKIQAYRSACGTMRHIPFPESHIKPPKTLLF